VRRLQDNTDTRMDAVQGEIAVILAVDLHRSGLRLVEPAHQVDDGGLSSPGRPHQGNSFSAFHVQVKILQHRLLLVVVIVPEGGVEKFNVAMDRARVESAWAIGD